MLDACLDTDTLVAVVEGGDDAVRLRVERHASRCDSCRRAFSALAEGGRLRELPPEQVGRYVIVRELGRGGMGVVHAAHDPELGRTVAVKLLRDADPTIQRRLKREAQAMAQLAHPNVAGVHDVGEHDGRTFVAMEYVDGETLSSWARSQSPRAIVAAYLEAGRGLAAAHAAGIIHRDFKPENVLVGRDGRVRVVDFGLARPWSSAPALQDPAIDLALTESGTIAGTPRYMAPEVLAGGDATAASDQFSFCVALFVSLTGVAPFAGDTLEELARNVRAGNVRALVAPGVGRRVRAVIGRGIAVRPEDRFPGMDSLLAALAPRRERKFVIGGVGVLVATTTAMVWFAQREPVAETCTGADAKMESTWGASRKQAARAAILGTQLPYAAATWQSVERTLARYATDWSEMYTSVCEATHVRGEQSDAALDLKMTCLSDRARRFDAFAQVLASADRTLVERAVSIAHDLPAIADCADLTALGSDVRPPDAGIRKQVDALREELATLHTRWRSRGENLLAAARDLRSRVEHVGYRPLEADAHALVGEIALDHHDYPTARAAHDGAILAAEAGRADRRIASSLIALIAIVGRGMASYDDVPALHERARAVLERIDHPADLEAALLGTMGAHALAIGDFVAAERDLRAALAAAERVHGRDDLRLVGTLVGLATLELQRDRGDAARPYLDRAYAIHHRVYGADHPDVAHTLHLLGNAAFMTTRYDEAVVLFERARTIYERAHADDSLAVAQLLGNLANVYEWQGRTTDAIVLHRRAVAIATVKLGALHPSTLRLRIALASALEGANQFAEARGHLEEVLAAQKLANHQDTALTLGALANVELATSQFAAARDHARAAMAMYEQTLGEGYNPSYELGTLGEALLGLDDAHAAVDVLTKARAGADASSDPGTIAWLDAVLGRALIESKRDRARGAKLMQSAWSRIASDERMTSEREILRRWMTGLRVAVR